MKQPRSVIAGGAAAGLLAVAALASGCAGPAADDGRLQVVVSVYPFEFVAGRVGGDQVAVTNLTQPGAEPHDLELTPRQVASLGEADLIVYEQTFQPVVDEAVAQSGNPQALDTTTVVALQPLSDEEAHGNGEEGHGKEGHGAGDEHEGEAHEHSGLDPHVWLDPTNLATIAEEVARRLAAIDPDHAAGYQANAATLAAQLQDLDQSFRTQLRDCQRREFITSHAAFGYLARAYELTQIGISGLSPDAEPSPARVVEVQQEAREHGLTTIFYETLVSPEVAKSIADDLGLRTDVLDPLEGITPESRGSDYLAVMAANLTALREAGGCR